MTNGLEILTVAQMAAVDRRSAELGAPTTLLMENAGTAVAEACVRHWPGRPVCVLAGPGNNGGDGYVAARLIAEAGGRARVLRYGPSPRGDAAQAAARWTGGTDGLATPDQIAAEEVVVDALFGAGLARALDGPAGEFAARSAVLDVLAVDVPSGLPGDGAAPLGPVVSAKRTVTFVRKKPAHVLEPGRSLCGEVILADIGAPEAAVREQAARLFDNAPALWPGVPAWPDAASHKHARGKVAVWARTGNARPSATLGAQRLAARAAQRLAGWVSVFCAPGDIGLFLEPASLVVRADDDPSGHGAIVFGCGAGRGAETRDAALRLARLDAALTLDADALSSFEDDPTALFAALAGRRAVLTPHLGEFRRLFPEAAALPDKVALARAAAARAGVVVLVKGADTVIAAPDGICAVNAGAPAWLASAGTGDVLAGVIAALLAQGAQPFAAACCAAYLHAEAGRLVGPGLIADDLIAALPEALNALAPAALRRRGA